MKERKLQCPNCSQPMHLKRIQSNHEQPAFAHYDCMPCGVGISDAVDEAPHWPAALGPDATPKPLSVV